MDEDRGAEVDQLDALANPECLSDLPITSRLGKLKCPAWRI